MKVVAKLIKWLAVIGLLAACTESGNFYESEMPEPESDGAYDHARMGLGLDQDRYITMKGSDMRIHYRIIGKGPIDVVLLPGWTNPLTVYTQQFEYFRNRARCIYIDPPGQGLSDSPEDIDYTIELMADAMYDVVKKEGLHKFIGVGFSLGPVILGQFELKHPGMMTKLINLDGGFTVWPTEDPDRAAFIAWRENYFTNMLGWDLATKQFLLGILIPPTAPAELYEWGQYFLSYPNWLMANIWYNGNAEEVNQPIGWTMPIMSIYTSEPTNMTYEQLYFPDADIHVMEGSGHVVQWERADEVNALIDAFISDRPGKKY